MRENVCLLSPLYREEKGWLPKSWCIFFGYFLKDILLVYSKIEWQRGGRKNRVSVYWFTPSIAARARIGPVLETKNSNHVFKEGGRSPRGSFSAGSKNAITGCWIRSGVAGTQLWSGDSGTPRGKSIIIPQCVLLFLFWFCFCLFVFQSQFRMSERCCGLWK